MNQAMPQWRTFSGDDPDGAAEPTVPDQPAIGMRTWLAAGAGAVVGAVTAAILAAGLLITLGASASEPIGPWGEPLGNDGAGLGVGPVEQAAPEPSEIVVDVAGAVVRPGLQRLTTGNRIGDAIEAAGGYAPRVDLAATAIELNLAQVLSDGAKVLVPELGIDAPRARAVDDSRIDINRAGQADLEALPGIGPVTARKIIAAREEQRFEAVRDLRTRGLIGSSVFEKINELLRA